MSNRNGGVKGDNIIHILKQDIQNNQARITMLEEQIKNLADQLGIDAKNSVAIDGQTGSNHGDGTAGAFNLDNFKDSSGRIDFDRFNQEIRTTMYNVRSLTMGVRGYVALAKEAGILNEDQQKAYQNLMQLIRIAYNVQRAIDAANTTMLAFYASNPIGVAMGLITLGGRGAV
jgi:hypothetical protein